MEQPESYPFVSPATEDRVEELPKWVKISFRVYAVFLLISAIIIGAKLAYSAATVLSLLRIPLNEDGLLFPIIYGIAAVILMLQVFFAIGVYRLRRWVLPLLVFFSLSTILLSGLVLWNRGLSSALTDIAPLVGIVFAVCSGYIAVVYWSRFAGSARKLRVQIPLILVTIPVIVFGVLMQLFKDDPQLYDADLLLQPVAILPESDNAHYALPDVEGMPESEKQVYETVATYVQEHRETDPFTKKHTPLNFNNETAIQLTKETKSFTDAVVLASTKKGYQCPTSVNVYTYEVKLCPLGGIRELADMTAFRAAVEADTGNYDQAITTAASIVKLGGLMANAEQPILIEYLLGVSLVNTGLESLERTLSKSSSTSNDVLQVALSELEQSHLTNNGVMNSIRRSYMEAKNLMQAFEQHSGYFYQHNKTLNQRASVDQMTVSILEQDCNIDTKQAEDEVDQLVDEIITTAYDWPLISPNFMGKTLNRTTIASLGTIKYKVCETNERNLRVQQLLRSKITPEPEAEAVVDSVVR